MGKNNNVFEAVVVQIDRDWVGEITKKILNVCRFRFWCGKSSIAQTTEIIHSKAYCFSAAVILIPTSVACSDNVVDAILIDVRDRNVGWLGFIRHLRLPKGIVMIVQHDINIAERFRSRSSTSFYKSNIRPPILIEIANGKFSQNAVGLSWPLKLARGVDDYKIGEASATITVEEVHLVWTSETSIRII